MTTDNLEATLIDDSCFSDIFTMQSQFLDDFEFGLEANNIDTLLELFEEEEKKCDTIPNKTNNFNKVLKNNSNVNQNERNDSIIMISLPKVRKSTNSSASDVSNKRKGTSLLAKPKKTSPKRSLININDRDFQSISSLLQDHDYCLISEDNNQLYNKLPDYITELTSISNISKSIASNNCTQNESYDKIPDYIKGFLNLNENIDKNEDFIDNNDNILIELNEAFIEVSDVVFDNDLYSIDDMDFEGFGEELNSESSDYSTLMSSEESKDMKELNDILADNSYLPQNEQKDSNNYNKSSNRRSRSRSREQRNQSFVKNRTQRRRRLSTRSSVDSKSDSSSSCSSCSSRDSYSSRDSEESKMSFELSNSIIRNESNGQPLSRKRSLKDTYCQNSYESKVRSKNCSETVFNVKSGRNSNSYNAKKDIEERRIIYVGKIPDGTTKTDIRYWFGGFGAIKEVSIHFRDRGDNYAFVTFHRRTDAFQAIEHANDDSRHPKFDLSFGGRRQFCKTRYEDLDFVEEDSSFNSERMDFDALLRSTKGKLNR